MDCCNLVAEDFLVDVYLHDIIQDYRIYLENLSLSSFSRLMEAMRRTKESVPKPQNQLYEICAKKRPIIVTMEKNKAAKASSSKKVPYTRKGKHDSLSF